MENTGRHESQSKDSKAFFRSKDGRVIDISQLNEKSIQLFLQELAETSPESIAEIIRIWMHEENE